MRNVLDKSYRENQNTNFIFNNFFFENPVIYEMMWKKTQNALLHFHLKNGYAKVPQCYVMCTSSILLFII
jgi:hypothetical protein